MNLLHKLFRWRYRRFLKRRKSVTIKAFMPGTLRRVARERAAGEVG